jgi:hypothetical protein
MPRLLTIDDLYDPHNNWKSLLEQVAWLGPAYEDWKKRDVGGRTVAVHFGDNSNRSPGLHASELNTCVRQAVYALRGEPRQAANPDVNMQNRFDVGTMLHALLQTEFEEVCATTLGQVSLEDEVRIDKNLGGVSAQYDYSSSCDGVFTFCDTVGQPYLRLGWEIKTTSADEFEKLTGPKDHHLQQATLYQKALDVPLMWFLYYNKSNSNWTPPTAPWVVPFNRNEWNTLEGRSQLAHQHLQAGTLPDREEGMPCKWCAFSETCRPTILKLHTTWRKKTSPPRRLTK